MGQVISPLSEDGQGCEPLSWDEDFTLDEMKQFKKDESFFLLLQRGGCSFSQKVRNAHLFGAKVLLISDYRDAQQESNDRRDVGGSIVNDGALIEHIPAFEIAWADAKRLIEYIKTGEEIVYMKATVDTKSADNKVNVDLWYSTSLDLGLHLSTELAAMSTTFSIDHANQPLFTPRIATYKCLSCSEEFKRANCMSEGLYCAYTPNFYSQYDLGKFDVSMTGKEILLQSLRESCLHKLLTTKYREEGDAFMYWSFFSMLGTCFAQDHHKAVDPPKSFDECYDWDSYWVRDVAEDPPFIRDCVYGSFEIVADFESDNKILRKDRAWASKNAMELHPSIVINGVQHSNSTG